MANNDFVFNQMLIDANVNSIDDAFARITLTRLISCETYRSDVNFLASRNYHVNIYNKMRVSLCSLYSTERPAKRDQIYFIYTYAYCMYCIWENEMSRHSFCIFHFIFSIWFVDVNFPHFLPLSHVNLCCFPDGELVERAI